MTRTQWIIRLLETVLANPPANRPVSLKAPSDPEEAYKAIIVYLDACQAEKFR